MTSILRLHHNGYRCRDSEQTRRFYEDFLDLPLAGSFEIDESKTGRATFSIVGKDGSRRCTSNAREPRRGGQVTA